MRLDARNRIRKFFENGENMEVSLDTMTGLKTPAFNLQVRKIRSSEEKWPNAIR